MGSPLSTHQRLDLEVPAAMCRRGETEFRLGERWREKRLLEPMESGLLELQMEAVELGLWVHLEALRIEP